MKTRAARTPATPIGMLMKKIQLQWIFWVSTPPTIGPNARASADTPAQIPIAVPRWRGGNVAVMIDSVAGFISAAPTPCTVRAAMSDVCAPSEPAPERRAVKTTRPTMKIAPPAEQVGELSSGQQQHAERQRVGVHDPLELRDADPEVLRIDGSATFTTVLSSMIMKSPTATATSVHHFRFSGVNSRALTPMRLVDPSRSALLVSRTLPPVTEFIWSPTPRTSRART